MKSVEEFRKNFDSVYYNKLLLMLMPYEQRRKEKLLLASVSLLIAIIMLLFIPSFFIVSYKLVAFLFPYGSEKSVSELASYVSAAYLIICGILLFLPSVIAKNFENLIKKDVMPILLNALPSFEWSTMRCINDEFIKNSRLFAVYNREYGDESFYGNYKNVDIKMWETELGNKTGSGKNSSYVVRFKGLLVALFPKKNYKGLTLIKKDHLIDFAPQGLQKVNLEDIEFEKKFNVYSTDQIEARYVLTTAFMERFKNIKVAFNASKIEASISKQGILIALSSRSDLFKVGKLYRPVADYEQFKVLAEEFSSILALIDELKLDQNVGL